MSYSSPICNLRFGRRAVSKKIKVLIQTQFRFDKKYESILRRRRIQKIQFLLGHVSVKRSSTTSAARSASPHPVNDRIGIEARSLNPPSAGRVSDDSPGVLQHPKCPSISARDPEIGVPKPGTEYAYTGKP